MENHPIFVLFAVVVIVVIIASASIAAERKRKRALEAWLAQRGYSIDWNRHSDYDEMFPELECLRRGQNRYAYEIISGLYENRNFLSFNYHYQTETRDSKGNRHVHHHHFSVAMLESPIALKPLFIRPEGLFDKIGTFFGAEDINFESAEFSRKFHVKAPDRKWAYDVLHTRLMDYLMSAPVFSIQLSGNRMFAWRDSRFKPAEYDDAATVMMEIVKQLPEYVVRQQTGDTQQAVPV